MPFHTSSSPALYTNIYTHFTAVRPLAMCRCWFSNLLRAPQWGSGAWEAHVCLTANDHTVRGELCGGQIRSQ